MGSGFSKMMKQAKKMQEDMARVQEGLKEKQVSATAGGGVVNAVASGDGRIVSIEFKPEVVDPEDIEMLQDLAISAVNQALEKAAEISQEEMGKITGGMGLPGMGF
jgi:nucleoid-associated protein EbfC